MSVKDRARLFADDEMPRVPSAPVAAPGQSRNAKDVRLDCGLQTAAEDLGVWKAFQRWVLKEGRVGTLNNLRMIDIDELCDVINAFLRKVQLGPQKALLLRVAIGIHVGACCGTPQRAGAAPDDPLPTSIPRNSHLLAYFHKLQQACPR